MTQAQALSCLVGGDSVFLTGPPGAGKTYVLNRFIKIARARGKTVAVTASTGIAATHIGGVTIHSWSGLGIKEHVSEHDLERMNATSKLVKRYNATDILIIDEISMLHGARLDAINAVAKKLRASQAPFGGMQVLLVGDLYQLPPITRGNDQPDFAHQSDAWLELAPNICYLTEQHRVTAGDALLDLLSAMRKDDVNEMHEMMLQERMTQKQHVTPDITRLYTHNIDVDRINQTFLNELDDTIHQYAMDHAGNATRAEQLSNAVLAPQKLQLKKGAEVMFVANNFGEGYVNGTRGTVVDFVHGKPLVVLKNDKEILVEKFSWKFEEDGRVIAEVAQLPLRLAWAITIHKSQGMSLDAAEIDLSRSFSPGMGYVALSRVRSIEGIYLSGINARALTMHPQIHVYDAELRVLSEALSAQTPEFVESDEHANTAGQVQVNEGLLAVLKSWRSSTAREKKIPAYMVLHDSTLVELAARQPATTQALKGVKGMGPMKIENYADDILKLIANESGLTDV